MPLTDLRARSMFLCQKPVVQSLCPEPSKLPLSALSSCPAGASSPAQISLVRNHVAHVLKIGRKIRFEQQQQHGRCSGKVECSSRARILGFRGGRGGGLACHAHSNKEGECLTTAPHAAEVAAVVSMEGKSLWSKLSQSVNVSGIYFSARVIVRDRHLAIPHVSVPDISWIDWEALRTRGFEGVLFDKDNTLTVPYGQSVWPPLTEALKECRAVFGGRVALLSNSAGLYQYDPLGAEAKIVEDRLGIPVIRHGQKKPAGNAIALSKYFNCDPAMLIMVGDRYFTDVVYGNSNGLFTIRPAPLTTVGEPFTVRQVRVLEDKLVDWWCHQGVLPTKHKFFANPVDFIKDPGCW